MTHFVHLTVIVQDVINYGFTLLPKIHQSDGNVFSSRHGLFGLLGSNHEHQHIVNGKKSNFHMEDCP
jgi:hypothetical protein